MDLVEALVDQSLLSVIEADGAVHYRMLETVREFGTLRLAESGERAEALAAQSAWAVALADRTRDALFGEHQVGAVDELSREENNLADVLRRAMADDDAALGRQPDRDAGHLLGDHRQQPAGLRAWWTPRSGSSSRGTRRRSWCRRPRRRSRCWSATSGSSRTGTSTR